MSQFQEMDPFWMVHGIGFGVPLARHATRAAATAEAERLARKHPGTAYVVLEAVEAVRRNEFERVVMRASPEIDDDIPF